MSSPPHADLHDRAPLSCPLGVSGVDGAVFPHGGEGGERGGIDVVGAGVGGEELPAGAGVLLDLDGFHGAFFPNRSTWPPMVSSEMVGATAFSSASSPSGPTMPSASPMAEL